MGCFFMLQNILYSVGAFLAAAGAASIISFIILRAVSLSENKGFVIITVFDGSDRKPEVKISCIISMLCLLGIFSESRITAVDRGMTSEQRERLKKAFQREKNIVICGKDDISDAVLKK